MMDYFEVGRWVVRAIGLYVTSVFLTAGQTRRPIVGSLILIFSILGNRDQQLRYCIIG